MKLSGDWLTRPETQKVLGMLSSAGHRALVVGGCVRNAVMGIAASDVDIATDAEPQRVLDLAKAADIRAVPTGIDHGTVTLVLRGAPHEVTTFRRDVETFGRHAVVAYSRDIADDARRRDFTMNALYAEADGTLVDPLGGLRDAQARRVRFIDDAMLRIAEDYLRILRFFRFHAWYGDPLQGLDAEGLAACAEAVAGLDKLSRERVGAEMKKLLAAPDPAPATAALAATGGLSRVLPGADPRPLAPLVHLEAQAGLAADPIRRLSALGGENVVEHLRLSRAEGKRLREIHHAVVSPDPPAVRGYRFGRDVAIDAALIAAASAGSDLPPSEIAEIERGAGAHFPVTAADLPDKGAALGRHLKALENRWVASDFALGRDDLLSADGRFEG